MSLIFSRETEYAIQALIYLARKEANEWVSIKEIASNLQIPQHFLGKIFQKLAQKRLLNSRKGVSGGFNLWKDPKNISIYDIVEAIDGDKYRTECIIGFPDCSNSNPCPVHDKWKSLRDELVKMIKSKNLYQLAYEIKKPGY